MQEVLSVQVHCTSCCLPHSRQLLAPNDIVRGHVIMVRPHGVFVRVTSFMYSLKSRELPDLKIKVTLPSHRIRYICVKESFFVQGLVTFENLAETQEKCKKLLEELQEEDVVQGVCECGGGETKQGITWARGFFLAVVTGVDEDECLVELSFQQNHLPATKQDVTLVRFSLLSLFFPAFVPISMLLLFTTFPLSCSFLTASLPLLHSLFLLPFSFTPLSSTHPPLSASLSLYIPHSGLS